MLERIIEIYFDCDILKADGFDEAVLGIDDKSLRLIYSVEKCLKVLMTRDRMSLEEAVEYFEFNVSGAYVGKKTPIWCYDNF